jgi:FkbM family methyltransferase
MAGRIAFVLAASEHGPLIVNRLDYLARGDLACGVGCSLLETGSHGAGEVETLLTLVDSRHQRLGDGVVYVDVGANIGTHAIPIARALGDRGRVFAFEAQERIFYALAGNVAINNCFNAKALWAAVGVETGTMEIPCLDHRKPANFGGLSLKPEIKQDPGQPVSFDQRDTATVACISLDDLQLNRCDVIKIDAEGMEPDVIDGAQKTIAKHRPVIFAETAICGSDAVIERLPGYRFVTAPMYVTAIHADDPMWRNLKVVNG